MYRMYYFPISEGNKISFTHIIVYYMRTWYAENLLETDCYHYITRKRIK